MNILRLLYIAFIVCGLNTSSVLATDWSGKSNTVSFMSISNPKYYIRHRDFFGEVSPISDEISRKDATFKIVPGLADSKFISLESVNHPNHYLRHQNWQIKLHKFEDAELFKSDATFNMLSGLSDASGISFQAHNYPDHFIRQVDFKLWISRQELESPTFKKEATFQKVTPLD